MRDNLQGHPRPPITISDLEYDRLSDLASSARARLPDVADELLSELDRAEVVPAASLPRNVVQMGSVVEFQADSGRHTRVTLVFPGQANVDEGKISIMTPVGAALIGLSAGQSITWKARNGRLHELTVLSVGPPSDGRAAKP